MPAASRAVTDSNRWTGQTQSSAVEILDMFADSRRNVAGNGKPAGLGVVENRVVWDDKMLAAEPDRADSRARGGIFGTAES
ncbi:MAG: hypothetical protein ACLQU5_23765 [Isosphaeraceae bacterium]